MPATIRSTGASNKLRVPFVRGRFSMGGTGILPFCGTLGLQLALARRTPELSASTAKGTAENGWGFAIVRKFAQNECPGTKQSHFRYLALPDGSIANFGPEPLEALPSWRAKTQTVGYDSISVGMSLRMWEIQELPHAKNPATGDCARRIDALLPGLARAGRDMRHSRGLCARWRGKSRLGESFADSAALKVKGRR